MSLEDDSITCQCFFFLKVSYHRTLDYSHPPLKQAHFKCSIVKAIDKWHLLISLIQSLHILYISQEITLYPINISSYGLLAKVFEKRKPLREGCWWHEENRWSCVTCT